ncbi:hypothetical protein L2E82_27541 [Cichorium intybus]|uniref:Uncharacterized protein n=1 Tax=Cichorium intybus TaxID=13427 RepID=A0ACB9CTD8_CICIN|nr:hypothetical protein L2E82_27541 [Cichorium intybus]
MLPSAGKTRCWKPQTFPTTFIGLNPHPRITYHQEVAFVPPLENCFKSVSINNQGGDEGPSQSWLPILLLSKSIKMKKLWYGSGVERKEGNSTVV